MKSKRLLSIITAILLLTMTACSGGGTENTNPAVYGEGRYVESDVTPPVEGRFTSFVTADGTLVCFDEGFNTRFDSADGGKTWTESKGPGLGDRRTGNTALLEDGSLLVYFNDGGFAKFAPDGSEQPFAIEGINTDEGLIMSLFQTAGDKLLVGYSAGGIIRNVQNAGEFRNDTPEGTPEGAPEGTPEGEAPVEDRRTVTEGNITREFSAAAGQMESKTLLVDVNTGGIVGELTAENAIAAAVHGDLLYIMDSGGGVKSYNLSDGSPSGEDEFSFGSVSQGMGVMRAMPMILGESGGSTLASDRKGGMYAIRDSSLLHRDAEGSVTTVLDSNSYSIGAPGGSANAVYKASDDSIIISMTENNGNKLYRYDWDDSATVNPDKVLSVWSLNESSFVRGVISELRKRHPDAQITYEAVLEGESALSAEDAIKALNTQLLNGSGPDIIILDDTPVSSYASKGLLLDLTNVIDTGDMYENLLAPYKTDGLYCLPTQFLMPALMASPEALAKVNSLDDLVTLIVNGNDLPAGDRMGGRFSNISEDERAELYFEDLEELCNILWLSSASAIVQDNKLNTDALREYLEAAKAVSDKYNLAEDITGGNNGGMRMGMAVSVIRGGSATAITGSLMRYTAQMTNYGAFIAGSLSIMQMMMEREGSGLALFPGLVEGAWQPAAIAAISADTKVKDFAAEFVQTMLDAEVQSLDFGEGMPVTRGGFAGQIESINERLAENDRELFEPDIDAMIQPLQSPSNGDTVLIEMMWSTVERCCKGEIDIDGAVREIEQNVKNYLAERS